MQCRIAPREFSNVLSAWGQSRGKIGIDNSDNKFAIDLPADIEWWVHDSVGCTMSETLPISRNVGFIGLGSMGTGMAQNLIRAGFDLTVYDIRKETTTILREGGAHVADSPSGLAKQCEIIHVNVRTESQVTEVLFGGANGGVVGNAEPGTIVLIHSTIPPDSCREMAEVAARSSIRVIDAPVVGGGPRAATEGTLTIILGGDSAAIHECEDILAALGSRVFVVGAAGMAQVAKTVNNIMAVLNGVVVAEALAFASAAGLDEAVALDIVNAGSGASFLTANRSVIREMAQNSDMVAISSKDLAIALSHAATCGVKLPMTALGTQYTDAFLR